MPVAAPDCASTITIVVASHSNVPSDSGVAVGTVYTVASTCSTGGPPPAVERDTRVCVSDR